MERLTERFDGWSMQEDTGPDPEDIEALRDREQGLVELLVNVSCGCAVSYTRLAELARAEKDGRLVVLPCKVGDTIYVISYGGIVETKVRTFFLGHPSHKVEDRKMRMIRTTNWDISMDEVGKRIFFTREEAEAALKKEEADNEAN